MCSTFATLTPCGKSKATRSWRREPNSTQKPRSTSEKAPKKSKRRKRRKKQLKRRRSRRPSRNCLRRILTSSLRLCIAFLPNSKDSMKKPSRSRKRTARKTGSTWPRSSMNWRKRRRQKKKKKISIGQLSPWQSMVLKALLE